MSGNFSYSNPARGGKKMKRILSALFAFVLVISTLACAADAAGFIDVSSDAWYADAVAYCQ